MCALPYYIQCFSLLHLLYLLLHFPQQFSYLFNFYLDPHYQTSSSRFLSSLLTFEAPLKSISSSTYASNRLSSSLRYVFFINKVCINFVTILNICFSLDIILKKIITIFNMIDHHNHHPHCDFHIHSWV